ncbi:MAG TPA: nuclear transport factor 2 family protein [Acidimicrobiales bacterium]|nr:nuclear transport factor 2 family protein [Acidimicrobiales bacterium]
MDWQEWAHDFENIEPDEFAGLFAQGGLFCDPVTPWTTDVQGVADQTRAIFPDWTARVDSIRSGERWAVFEWTGSATFLADTDHSVAVTVHGATIVEVDDHDKVTRWRDYLDTNEPMRQIKGAVAPSS